MKKYFSFVRRIKLTQDLSGFTHFENFFLATILTILVVRFFLKLSGYPQLGGGGLHIAHMLWGGLVLMMCLLINLLFMDRRLRAASAIVGGIGFGLFVDELGKFVTADNNYFFQPTIAILYVLFVLLFLLIHAMKNLMTISKEEYISNALDIFRNSLVHGISEFEKEQVLIYLKEARADFRLPDLYKVVKEEEFPRREVFATIQRWKVGFIKGLDWLVGKKVFQVIVILIIELQALFSFLIIGLAVLYYSNVFPDYIKESIALDFDFASVAAIVSSFLAGILAVLGVLVFTKSRQAAFTFIKYSLFVSIFLVQIFIFWLDQFGGLVGLVFNIVALETVNVILAKEGK